MTAASDDAQRTPFQIWLRRSHRCLVVDSDGREILVASRLDADLLAAVGDVYDRPLDRWADDGGRSP